MKKNRYIPFGYAMENGKLTIVPEEAEVVRDIFVQYVEGASLKDIAEKLTREQIPYSEKMTDWGKARVSRIIENAKYLGYEDGYDRIIEDDLFLKASSVKAERMTAVPGNLISEIKEIRDRVRCIRCGCPMTRKSGNKIKTTTEWTCTNPECGLKVGITDENLLEKIMRILSRISENDRLLDTPAKKKLTVPDDLKRQLQEEFERGVVNQEKTLQIIYAIASEQYKQISQSTNHQADVMKRKIRRIEIRDGFNPELFNAIVSVIRLGNGKIDLVTKNNITIGDRYGNNEDTEKDGHADNT